jgi:hypothetical protein
MRRVCLIGLVLALCLLLGALRAQDSLNISLIGRLQMPDIRQVVVQGDYVYASCAVWDNDGRLDVVDVSQPASPVIVGTYRTGYNFALAGLGDIVYVSTYSSIKIISIADPTDPTLLGSLPYESADILVNGSLMALVGGWIYLFDLSDPELPDSLSRIIPLNNLSVGGAAMLDTTLYLESYDPWIEFPGGQELWNLSEPGNPYRMIYLDRGCNGIDYLLTSSQGGYAACGTDGIYRFGWGGCEPCEVDGFEPVNSRALDWRSPYLFVADGDGGLIIVRCDRDPYVCGYYRPGIYVRDVVVSGDKAYVVCEDYLYILDCSAALSVPSSLRPHPSSLTLLSAYPNPFNSTTTIRFTLPRAGQVRLAVHDLVGRKVKDLIPGSWMGAGEQRVILGSEGLSSGTYQIRLRNRIDDQKGTIILIR